MNNILVTELRSMTAAVWTATTAAEHGLARRPEECFRHKQPRTARGSSSGMHRR
jgi:hypothetical protein